MRSKLLTKFPPILEIFPRWWFQSNSTKINQNWKNLQDISKYLGVVITSIFENPPSSVLHLPGIEVPCPEPPGGDLLLFVRWPAGAVLHKVYIIHIPILLYYLLFSSYTPYVSGFFQLVHRTFTPNNWDHIMMGSLPNLASS